MAQDRRSAILDAAQELIQTRGANGISYQHISDRVTIRKASIHYHFPTKDKLIEAVVQRYCVTFLNLVDAIIGSRISPPAKLEKYIGLFEATLRDGSGGKVCLCGMLGAELRSLGSPAATKLRRFYTDNAVRLGQILDQGRATKTLQFEGDSETVGMLVFSFLEGAMVIARADGGVGRFRALGRQLLKLLGG
jgi:TetR/AcrR family transcriptional repressor of nem operon